MKITTKGKEAALKALRERRILNKDIERIRNDSLPAGAPMYFYCVACGGLIIVPESYVTKSNLCGECETMKKLGWLTE
jgi:hypothetical protein